VETAGEANPVPGGRGGGAKPELSGESREFCGGVPVFNPW
jgi:hypothetical protein